MSIYTIDFTVRTDGVTPQEPQAAGVTGDHQAALLRFTVPFADYRYRIEVADGGGGYDITDLLTVQNNTITYPVPSAWTAAGIAALRLVGIELDKNGQETVRFHSAPAYVWFADRENGEALGSSLQPAWQETLDEAQLFLESLSQRVESGEFKGEKGDKGDTGNVSVVDELELVIDGGDAGGTVDLITADHVVEQGQASGEGDATPNRWVYRKWASGLVELWGWTSVLTGFTDKKAECHYAGVSFEQLPYPFTLYGTIHAQFSLHYVGGLARHTGFCVEPWADDRTMTPKYTPYSIAEVTDAIQVTGRYYVMARWKE